MVEIRPDFIHFWPLIQILSLRSQDPKLMLGVLRTRARRPGTPGAQLSPQLAMATIETIALADCSGASGRAVDFSPFEPVFDGWKCRLLILDQFFAMTGNPEQNSASFLHGITA